MGGQGDTVGAVEHQVGDVPGGEGTRGWLRHGPCPVLLRLTESFS